MCLLVRRHTVIFDARQVVILCKPYNLRYIITLIFFMKKLTFIF